MKQVFNILPLNKNLMIIITIVTIVRLISIAVSPLEISADEAQYWLWSNDLKWGYFSKPPIIAWVIFLSTSILGVSEFSIRFFAPILHTITAILIYKLSRDIYGDKNNIAFTSAIVWLSLPIIGVGSFLISTDTPLMLIWTASLLAINYAKDKKRVSMWLFAGSIAGIGMLAKYASIYLPLGIMIWFLLFYKDKTYKKLKYLIFYLLGFVIFASPNLIWNLNNNFNTINHLSDNAVISTPNYSITGSISFILSQVAVLGPILFFVSIISIWNFWKNNHKINWLLCFILPVFILMIIQGFFSEANANWSATALPGLTIFCAAYLSKYKLLSKITISSNFIICLIIVIISITGSLGNYPIKSDPLRKLKGWDIYASEINKLIDNSESKIVLVNRRGVASPLIFYLRETDILIRVPKPINKISNHYQKYFAITNDEESEFIFVSEEESVPEKYETSHQISFLGNKETHIAKNKSRDIYFYLLKR